MALVWDLIAWRCTGVTHCSRSHPSGIGFGFGLVTAVLIFGRQHVRFTDCSCIALVLMCSRCTSPCQDLHVGVLVLPVGQPQQLRAGVYIVHRDAMSCIRVNPSPNHHHDDDDPPRLRNSHALTYALTSCGRQGERRLDPPAQPVPRVALRQGGLPMNPVSDQRSKLYCRQPCPLILQHTTPQYS